MSEHYYSNDPKSKSNPTTWEYTLRNRSFAFTSDFGVFSKGEVDFGSRVLIEAFEEPEAKGDFLDVGCGYGPIGLSVASSYRDRHVYMIDINKRAIELAKHNAHHNQVDNVTVMESNLFVGVSGHQFAAILTNPPIRAGKQVVHSILEQSYEFLVDHGTLWVVIQKKQGAPSARKKLEEIYDDVSVVAKEKGYYILKAEKFD
ncbi:class I SAM-dependent methyltransferase [Salinibacillus xinjiangensis]|uniref:Methyltransferase n=1 Tax=Salinibacillus xinjiangensis TaxID=1229268 RepID=A0A6G1XAP1_9BACI|nr:class I SAM-dependent methyltransferase [Salinibacillus xinjiangensis]MRG88007.1 methyltransferase [Salinibacillus xinjiangensis]